MTAPVWTDPTAHVYATGETVLASTLNTYVQTNLAWLGNSYSSRMHQATAQSIANASETIVSFDTIDWDSGGQCTTGTGAKFTAALAAKHIVLVTLSLAGATYTDIFAAFYHNGSEAARGTRLASNDSTATTVVAGTSLNLAVGDTVQAAIYQSSTAARNTIVGGIAGCVIDVIPARN